MSFSLRSARYFVAAARSGQVSRAAVELNVSQSAVTAAIQQLEGELGVQLFERHARGVSLTHAGSRFLAHAETISAAVNEALHALSRTPAKPSGKVRVGVTYTVSGYFIGPLLNRIKRALPEIEIDMREADRTDIERALLGGNIDLAVILTSNLVHRDRLAFETLVRSQRRLWLAADHPLARKAALSLADVAAFPYIALTVDEALRTQKRYWKQADVQPAIVFSSSSVEAVRTMVASGLGVTVLSDLVYRPWSLEGSRVETRDLSSVIPTLDVGVVWNAEKPRDAAAEELVNYLVQCVRADTGARH